jgi:phosphate transport system substrate-binding protein
MTFTGNRIKILDFYGQKRHVDLSVSILLAMLLLLPWSGLAAENITVTGSTSMFPFLERAAEAYMSRYPRVAVSIATRGSSDGVRSILDGISSLAGISRNLTLREKALARKRGIKLIKIPVALGCVVPVVHIGNPVEDISLEQLRDVYTGVISNWRKLGGPDRPITLLSRSGNSGTFEMLREAVLGQTKTRSDALLLASSGTMAQAVSGNPGALGYLGLGYVSSKIKLLKINGITPTPENIREGIYPLARELAVLMRAEPDPGTRGFVDFLLSKRGQEIAAKMGLVSLRASGN